MLLDGALSSSLCKWVSSLGGKWGQGSAGLVILTLWLPSEVRLSWQQIIITKVPSTQPLPCLLYLWTPHRGSGSKVLLHLTKQRLGSCALAQTLLWEAVGFSKSVPPSFSKPWSDHWRILEDKMVSTSRAAPQSSWKLFEGSQGPLVIRKQGVCIRMEAFVYTHSRARDSKLLSYGFSSLGGERTSLASLFQASSTGHASGSGNQNLVGFSFLYTKFQKSPSCWVSSGTRKKKSHYGWMQGTDLTHNQWFLPASDKACFLQLITSPGNTHDVCIANLHARTFLHPKGRIRLFNF